MADAKGRTDALSPEPTKASPLTSYKETIADLTSQAKDFINDAACQLKNKAADLKDIDLSEISEKARASVRQNPGKALLISAGIGVAIGIVLRATRS